MKKRLTVLFATMLCVCSLLLVACGGTAEEQTADEAAKEEAAQEEAASEEEPQEEEKADASEKFLGEWVLAAMSSEGMTIVVDFRELSSSEDDMTMVINEDGTARLSFDDIVSDATWKLKDDAEDTIILTKAKDKDEDKDKDDGGDDVDVAEDEGDDTADELVDDALDDGLFTTTDTLEAVMQDDTVVITIESNDYVGTLTFSRDGKLKDLPILKLSDATDFKTTEQLVGEWTIAAMVNYGVTMYGDSSTLGDEGFDSSLEFYEDGTMKFMGMSLEWGLDGDGAFISTEGQRIPLKLLQGMVLIDMTEATGQELMLAYRQ